jgi:hypothetical protein
MKAMGSSPSPTQKMVHAIVEGMFRVNEGKCDPFLLRKGL